MNYFTAIISAYEQFEGGYFTDNNSYIAFANVHGKPVIDWIVSSIHSSLYINNILVTGPESIDTLLCSRHINNRLTAPVNGIYNELTNLNKVSSFLKNGYDNQCFLFIYCGMIYMNMKIINSLISTFNSRTVDIGLIYTQNDLVNYRKSVGLHIKGGKKYNISKGFCFVKDRESLMHISQLFDNYSKADEFFPISVASNVNHAEELLSERFGARIGLLPVDDQWVLNPITSFDDTRKAEARLSEPWKQRFRNAKVLFNPSAGINRSLPRFFNNRIGIKQNNDYQVLSDKELQHKILAFLHKFNVQAEMVITDAKRPVSVETRRLISNNADCIIAAGGDGTINAVVNALANTDVPLGIIPLGTANVMAIEFSIPTELRSACQLIAQGEIRSIDLGKCNDRYFSCVAGIGIDAYITQHVNQNSTLKRQLGIAAYFLTGFFDYFRYHFKPISITIDNNQIQKSGYLIMIGNGKHYGGKMVFSPDAVMDDGILEIVIYKSSSILSVIKYLNGFIKGTLPDLAAIDYLKGKTMSISSEIPQHVHLDGEFYGYTPVEINVVPKSLNVIC